MKDWSDIHSCGNTFEFYDYLIKVLPGNAKVLEMGVFYGRGLIYLAQKSTFKIYGVDQFKVDEMPHQEDTITTDLQFYERCCRNLHEHGANRVALIWMDSENGSKEFLDHFFDCVFIDGKHDYESVRNDISLWCNKVKAGGYLAGDDYVKPWGGVIQAVDEAFPQRLVMGQTWYTML